ncbi:MAG: methylglutaconyl-CoA hydratase [Oleispira sp.]|jgi:methylglutaconyl-CoA hydratase
MTDNSSLIAPSPLLIEHDHGVTILTLNRPAINNAFDDEMISLLIEALDDCRLNDDVKVVKLTGAGKHFSAGADLNWMRRMADLDYSENREDAGQLARLMSSLYHLNKPTIAQISGASYGGAIGLIACCDIAIASEKSIFCLSEVKIGLIPAVISPYVVKAIGERQARRYFITAEVIKSEQALALNLVHEVVPLEALKPRVDEIVSLMLNNGPKAMGISKALVQKVVNEKLDDDLKHHTRDLIAQVRVSEEGQEGLSAFLEKRPANWIKAVTK